LATHRVTDSSHWSPLANVHTPAVRIPPCKTCGQPSLGGVCVELASSHPVGQPVSTCEFYCAEHNPGTFYVMSDRLFPVYRILEQESPSILKIQRLDRETQERRLKQ
jgi:hypothetical protein